MVLMRNFGPCKPQRAPLSTKNLCLIRLAELFKIPHGGKFVPALGQCVLKIIAGKLEWRNPRPDRLRKHFSRPSPLLALLLRTPGLKPQDCRHVGTNGLLLKAQWDTLSTASLGGFFFTASLTQFAFIRSQLSHIAKLLKYRLVLRIYPMGVCVCLWGRARDYYCCDPPHLRGTGRLASQSSPPEQWDPGARAMMTQGLVRRRVGLANLIRSKTAGKKAHCRDPLHSTHGSVHFDIVRLRARGCNLPECNFKMQSPESAFWCNPSSLTFAGRAALCSVDQLQT